jgi:hypothetical protein
MTIAPTRAASSTEITRTGLAEVSLTVAVLLPTTVIALGRQRCRRSGRQTITHTEQHERRDEPADQWSLVIGVAADAA